MGPSSIVNSSFISFPLPPKITCQLTTPDPPTAATLPIQIRFGILGCANIARKLSRAIHLSPDATLQAIASRSISNAQSYAEANGYAPTTKLYGSYDAVLDDPEVDAVYIPLPTSLHLHWAVAAAHKGKHVLLEKPVALNVAELDEIIAACDECGVQFMDGTMWMHHPRTLLMDQFLRDAHRFGQLKSIHTHFSFLANDNLLENDIRIKPDLDALGALGDVGWYCIRASLFAANYQLPKVVTAFKNPVKNKAGVILSCGASLQWKDGAVGTFHCSFLSHLTMDISAVGTKGTLRLTDFVIPFEEKLALFSTLSDGWFADMELEWSKKPTEHVVNTALPQEVHMVNKFSSLVDGIKRLGLSPDKTWPMLTRKTQLVIDAVVASIDRGFLPVEVY